MNVKVHSHSKFVFHLLKTNQNEKIQQRNLEVVSWQQDLFFLLGRNTYFSLFLTNLKFHLHVMFVHYYPVQLQLLLCSINICHQGDITEITFGMILNIKNQRHWLQMTEKQRTRNGG